MGYTGEQNL